MIKKDTFKIKILMRQQLDFRIESRRGNVEHLIERKKSDINSK
jgi:hypothetical protein